MFSINLLGAPLDFDNLLAYTVVILFNVFTLRFYWKRVAGERIFVSAPNGFLFWQILFFIGTLIFIDMDRPDDQLWLLVISVNLFCFAVGALVANTVCAFRPRQEIERFTTAPIVFDLHSEIYWYPIIGMSLICLGAGIVFASSVGYSVTLWSVQALLTGGGVNTLEYSRLRTGIANASGGYVAPGFALQFTANLMPIVICLMYFRARYTRRFSEILFTLLLFVMDVYFLTIAGGRGYLLLFFLAAVLLVSPFGPVPAVWKSVRRVAWGLIGSSILFYSILTIMIGRVASTGVGPGQLFSGLLHSLFDRVIGSANAGDQLTIMHYFMSQPQPVVWGAEWGNALLSIVSAEAKGYSLANQLHGLVYTGNEAGHVGLLAWTSFWYNWGTLGSFIWAFFTGVGLQYFTIRYVRGDRALSRLILLFFAGYFLAQFRDPYSLLLNGFVTAMLYYQGFALVGSGSPRIQHTRRTPDYSTDPPKRGELSRLAGRLRAPLGQGQSAAKDRALK